MSIKIIVNSARQLETELFCKERKIYEHIMYTSHPVYVFVIRENQVRTYGNEINCEIATLLNSLALLYGKKIVVLCEYPYGLANVSQLYIVRK